MGLFVNRKNQLNKHQLQQVRKQVGIDLSKYAQKDDIDKYFNEKVTSEERKRLWSSMSPRLRLKVLQFVKERREESKNGKQ
jgi:hypothetical protein